MKTSTQRRKRPRAQRPQRKRKSHSPRYPRFARFKDELIKVGWSKKEKKEYQHKSPRRVVDRLVDRIIKVGSPGEIFSTDQLFPLRGNGADSEVPSYQAYLCLAWLRSIGLVHQHGRRGYSTMQDIDALAFVEAAWSELPVVKS